MKEEVGFFDAIKARLAKFDAPGFTSNVEMETAIRQVIDQALVFKRLSTSSMPRASRNLRFPSSPTSSFWSSRGCNNKTSPLKR